MLQLKNQTVWVVLSPKGRHILQRAQLTLPESEMIEFYAEESDELGLWVSFAREDGERLLLVRWEHIQAVEIRWQTKAVGPVN